jgi:hypothetical protein
MHRDEATLGADLSAYAGFLDYLLHPTIGPWLHTIQSPYYALQLTI